MQESISELVRKWTNGTFCMRSGYYAGRPPSEGDLGSKHLQMLYDGIRTDVGERQATNFVRFVNKLDDMAATPFIVAFERFWGSDCQNVDVVQSTGDRTRLDARGSALQGQALGVILSAMSSRTDDATYRYRSEGVKARFIQDHLDEIPSDEVRSRAGSYSFG